MSARQPPHDTIVPTETRPAQPAPAYHLQLDALRAFAVIAVVIHHYVPGGWGPGADAGVKLFFTLSGFLITGLLLKSRQSIETRRQPFTAAIGRFYARRFLRIFPLYYLVIAVALVINLPPAREIVWWLVTYTLNILQARQGWYEEHFAHFWSLAVEEQFYLVWPWVILAAPTRALVPLAATMTLMAPAFRVVYVLSGYESTTGIGSYISTLSCLDSLGCGALLALALQRINARTVDWWLYRVCLPLALVTCVMLWLPVGTGDSHLIAYPVAQAIVFAAVIRRAATGWQGTFGQFMQSAPLAYLGRISYGLYVYHPLAQDGVIAMGTAVLPAVSPTHWAWPVVAVFVTLAVASISWTLVERPLNELKRFFRDPV